MIKFVIAFLCLGIFFPSSVFAQTEEKIFFPVILAEEAEEQAVQAQEEVPIKPCMIIGGWLGEIWCNFVYIMIVDNPDPVTPNPTPIPTPEPTPIPVEIYYLSSDGMETVKPWSPWQNVPECKWSLFWRHCQIQVKFDIKQSECTELIGIALKYSDGTFVNARVNVDKFWSDEADYLWLQFFRLAYDYESGFEAWRYTATASCEKDN